MFYPNLRDKCANALETAEICPFVGSPAERLAPLFSSFLGEGLQNLYRVRFGQPHVPRRALVDLPDYVMPTCAQSVTSSGESLRGATARALRAPSRSTHRRPVYDPRQSARTLVCFGLFTSDAMSKRGVVPISFIIVQKLLNRSDLHGTS